MERYDIEEYGQGMIASHAGYWAQYDDFRAFLADCLKPVPVGEEVNVTDIPARSYFTVDGKLYFKASGWCYDVNGKSAYRHAGLQAATPVRLVPALEALEGRNDG
jgi:hypothetical protein